LCTSFSLLLGFCLLKGVFIILNPGCSSFTQLLQHSLSWHQSPATWVLHPSFSSWDSVTIPAVLWKINANTKKLRLNFKTVVNTYMFYWW
jgi:hypothetical protein